MQISLSLIRVPTAPHSAAYAVSPDERQSQPMNIYTMILRRCLLSYLMLIALNYLLVGLVSCYWRRELCRCIINIPIFGSVAVYYQCENYFV